MTDKSNWKLVPVEPTREMLRASPGTATCDPDQWRSAMWSAMLSASPSPPPSAGVDAVAVKARAAVERLANVQMDLSLAEWCEISSAILQALPPPSLHADDIAVDRFVVAMKAKLAKKRAEGRGGWEDKQDCSNAFLSKLLREHIDKGDPVDVGNLAMMIHQRGERIV